MLASLGRYRKLSCSLECVHGANVTNMVEQQLHKPKSLLANKSRHVTAYQIPSYKDRLFGTRYSIVLQQPKMDVRDSPASQ